jgi:hypothetical protein
VYWSIKQWLAGGISVNLRLISLKSIGPTECVVELTVASESYLSVFEINEHHGITTVSSDQNVFRSFDGDISELRAVWKLIAEFCRMARQHDDAQATEPPTA